MNTYNRTYSMLCRSLASQSWRKTQSRNLPLKIPHYESEKKISRLKKSYDEKTKKRARSPKYSSSSEYDVEMTGTEYLAQFSDYGT